MQTAKRSVWKSSTLGRVMPLSQQTNLLLGTQKTEKLLDQRWDHNQNPIWSVTSGSLALLQYEMEVKEFLVWFKIKVKNNENVIACSMEIDLLKVADGKRKKLDLYKEENMKDSKEGKLFIRCRHASNFDKDFVKNLKKDTSLIKEFMFSSIRTGIKVEKTFNPPDIAKNQRKSFWKRQKDNEKLEYKRIFKGVKRYRVRPDADPEFPVDWMTKEDVDKCSLQPSRSWVEGGSGNAGRIFVEVLSCDELPNKDIGSLTDTFVTLVYEDVAVCTDVIWEALSPRWVPWCRRAFRFNIADSPSELYVGVFDFDPPSLVDRNHDFIGRAVVDIKTLAPGTEYILHYGLQKKTNDDVPTHNGTIKLRIWVETENKRGIVLSSLRHGLKHFGVNVEHITEEKLVRNTCVGSSATTQFSQYNVLAHLKELFSYRYFIMFSFYDAFQLIFLWRGHYETTMWVPRLIPRFDKEKLVDKVARKVEVKLPAHSLVVFTLAVSATEYPSMIVPNFFFSIFWFMFSMNEFNQNNLSPWKRNPSFLEIVGMLLEHKPISVSILENKNKVEIEKSLKEWQERIDLFEKWKSSFFDSRIAFSEKALKEIGEGGGHKRSTTETKVKISAKVLPFLIPLQEILHNVCNQLRFVCNILSWKECFISFWISIGSLVLGVASLFVPWGYIIGWAIRIFVWTIFGPWMKLFDYFYFQPRRGMNDEQIEMMDNKNHERRDRVVYQLANRAQKSREDAVKLKDMRSLIFGQYSVTVLDDKRKRYNDIPLVNSCAQPLTVDSSKFSYKSFVPSQGFVMKMTPNV
eukprot:CAMPEP_0194446222 /NCGR_PEP_ID=MMETSP0176-20130528/128313_1 /TAXON_ID=216777 /ORGANISM="Proboscia alata, Strain PI-D3" /LENGTH=799 /DNA_ID=CAMNT_0039272899 /DNA_START=232 /DNA_END=2631 /DNA_ORIENTATION=-